MNSKGIAFGMGIVLAVLAAFTASAVADNIGRFDPQHGSAETGEYVPVIVYADIEEGCDLAGSGLTLIFNPEHIDIYSLDFACDDNSPTGPDQYCWGSLDVNDTYKENGYIWAFTGDPLESVYVEVPPPAHWEWQSMIYNGIEGPLENLEMYRIWVHTESDDTPGVSRLEFGSEMFPEGCPPCQKSKWYNYSGCPIPTTFINGTFTHEGEIPSETYEKELVSGWNLISLPLTATDMTVSNVIDTSLSGSYDELYKYNATKHNFVSLSSTDTIANGVGYFINMTAGDTWTYSGSASNSMNVGLSDGLNMVSWLNCSKDIVSDEALSSIDGNYYYVARWNAATQEFETYNPVAPDGCNDFTMLDRGEGYFISMKAGDTLEEGC